VALILLSKLVLAMPSHLSSGCRFNKNRDVLIFSIQDIMRRKLKVLHFLRNLSRFILLDRVKNFVTNYRLLTVILVLRVERFRLLGFSTIFTFVHAWKLPVIDKLAVLCKKFRVVFGKWLFLLFGFLRRIFETRVCKRYRRQVRWKYLLIILVLAMNFG